jgi:CheY-like chemotaxis protein
MCAAPLKTRPASAAVGAIVPEDPSIQVALFEDQHNIQSALTDMLRAVGEYRVIATLTTEAEGLAWAEQNRGRWNLAVIDLVLSQGNGISLISRCRRFAPDSKIVVFSGFVSPGIRKHCLRLGADAAFDKADQAAFIDYCKRLAYWFRSGGKPPDAGAAGHPPAPPPPGLQPMGPLAPRRSLPAV